MTKLHLSEITRRFDPETELLLRACPEAIWVLRFIFMAFSEVGSADNRYYTFLGCHRGDSLPDCFQQWMQCGGLDHFLRVFARAMAHARERMQNPDTAFVYAQLILLRVFPPVREVVEARLGHSAVSGDDLFFAFTDLVGSDIRLIVGPLVSRYELKAKEETT